MPRRFRVRWLIGAAFQCLIVLVGLSGESPSTRADQPGIPAALFKPAPQDTADLEAIERQIRGLIDTMLPATVGIRVGRAEGSGVVVSEDGYVLTAAHVTAAPNRAATVIFPDGTTVQGKTLGLHPSIDCGMVMITDQGKWAYAAIAPKQEAPRPGDWCLATGHPTGFQPDRPPPVRVGRVIHAEQSVLLTDCTITVGDSGGPLFDMRGRVIGIHSRVGEEPTMNLHVPTAAFHDHWDRLRASELIVPPPFSRFFGRFDTNRDGRVSRAEIPDGLYRQVYDRLVEKSGLDPDKTHTVDELRKALGLEQAVDPSTGERFRAERLPPISYRVGQALAPERFVNGRSVRSAFREAVAEASQSTVLIRCDGKAVALGTVVAAAGWIITKASQLSGAAVCQLPDGRELPAELVRSDRQHDLALLRLPVTDLQPVPRQASSPPPGAWVASAGTSRQPVAVGIVSVASRRISRTPGVMGVTIQDTDAGPRVVEAFADGGAAKAGIQKDDLITHILHQQVRDLNELQRAVREQRVGDTIQVTVRRADQEIRFNVVLSMPQDVFTGMGRVDRVNGAVSSRRDDFPIAIQHDTVLDPTQCGGPLVDLRGRVVGINVARADRIACYAVPLDTVVALFDELKTDQSATD